MQVAPLLKFWVAVLCCCTGLSGGTLQQDRRPLAKGKEGRSGLHASEELPRTVELGDYGDVMQYLASSKFQDVYWERFPVLLKTDQAFEAVLSLEDDVFAPSASYRSVFQRFISCSLYLSCHNSDTKGTKQSHPTTT